MVALCRFCRILGTLLTNGVSILQALKISKDSAGNMILAEVIQDAADSVKKGAALSAPLGECGLFPLVVVDMIAVAEESNNLDTVLVQIAETNEIRTARQIELGAASGESRGAGHDGECGCQSDHDSLPTVCHSTAHMIGRVCGDGKAKSCRHRGRFTGFVHWRRMGAAMTYHYRHYNRYDQLRPHWGFWLTLVFLTRHVFGFVLVSMSGSGIGNKGGGVNKEDIELGGVISLIEPIYMIADIPAP